MSQPKFVGRDAEMERLGALWRDAAAGRARVCFVTGEAGAGKSSLLHSFAAAAQRADARMVVASANCDAQTGQSDPYLPFLTLLEQLTGDPEAGGVQSAATGENARRLRSLVGLSMRTLLEHAPDLVGTFVPGAGLLVKAGKYAADQAGLLSRLEEKVTSRGGAGGAPAEAVDRDRIFRQYTGMLRALSAQCPLLLVLDDLHWADGASIDLLFHLGRALENERILLVGSYRPNDVSIGRDGRRHPLEAPLAELKRYLGDAWIDLDRAGCEQRRAFVHALVDAEPNRLDAEFREGLLRHTAGHPLFAVEVLRTLQERGDLAHDAEGCWRAAGPIDWDVLPARVEGVIEERIGRLTDELREVLTVASVEGTSFTTQVVARLREMGERQLLRLLSGELEKRHRLVVEGTTERVGARWVSQFAFSHVAFQQYLYHDLSARERMLLHAETAEVLEELYAGHTDRVALQLARHHELAGDPARAVDHRLRAASRALAVGAYAEARALLERSRELLAQVPAGPERDRRELEVLTRLCNVLNATEGWDSPGLPEIFSRSRELCEELGERAQLSRVLFGLWAYHLVQLQLQPALAVAREYFDLADALADHDTVLQAHAVMGDTLFWLGRPAEARDYAEAAMLLYAPHLRDEHQARFGLDPRMIPLMLLALSDALLGRAGRAAAWGAECVRVADEAAHPFSRAFALYAAALLAWLMGDGDAARAHAAALQETSERFGFAYYRGQAGVLRGWGMGMEGSVEDGLQAMRRGFEEAAANGGRGDHSLYCLMRAEVLRRAGRAAEALRVVDCGLAVARECGEAAFEPELLRVRGEALAEAFPEHVTDAAAYLERAIARARAQGTPLLEHRAAAGLARLRATVFAAPPPDEPFSAPPSLRVPVLA
ncbi:ATP-binding protein [Longimicrobium sp.]|uniref:ATP-binding protein n=1 Tax=Longimicrobium sp. TaxID=2029185 RepID=UPI002C5E9007|nr:AAA family ATPase [Longimicrobium sp.]HSU15346.1 AAA family ATPase [Longimicrobium sp.]